MAFVKNETYYTGAVYEWNLPAGHSCPFKLQCCVKVNPESGKMTNNSHAYRCYASSAERFPAVRKSRWENYKAMVKGDKPELPEDCKAVRIHASGDFFSQAYFDMWLTVCRENPAIEMWAFTKSIKYWIPRLNEIPNNLILTGSYGGTHDALIRRYKLKSVIVVKNRKFAGGLPVDYNDDLARIPKINFCLLDNNYKEIL